VRLARSFRNLSIRRKLTLIVMVTSSAALLVACAAFLIYDYLSTRQKSVADLSVTADGVGIGAETSLSFGAALGQEVTAALKANPHIVAAWVFDKQGEPFGEPYARDLPRPYRICAKRATATRATA
jgi:hypothetical protein